MGISQSMSVGCYQTQILECVCCGGGQASHKEDCPQLKFEQLRDQKGRGLCPKCRKGSVDINTSDFYECRKCHTQFTAGGAHEREAIKDHLIDDPQASHWVYVRELDQKGQGKFPIDESIALARTTYMAAKKARGRRRR